jgi:hypothetical protein
VLRESEDLPLGSLHFCCLNLSKHQGKFVDLEGSFFMIFCVNPITKALLFAAAENRELYLARGCGGEVAKARVQSSDD